MKLISRRFLRHCIPIINDNILVRIQVENFFHSEKRKTLVVIRIDIVMLIDRGSNFAHT